MKTETRIYLAVFFTVIYMISGFSEAYSAAKKGKKQLSAKITEKAANAEAGTSEEMVLIDLPPNQVQLVFGGGYFKALGEAGSVLDPYWAGRMMLRVNNVQGTLFGLGADLSYTRLPDIDYDGNMIYITLLPHANATFPLFNIVSVQVKGGPGLSVLLSKIRDKSDSSLSLTLGAGAGFFRVFGKRFIMGTDFIYNYYFQVHTSSSIAAYIYAGYCF